MATKQATLYGPNGQKVVVTVGSKEASQYQSYGWTLDAKSAAAKKWATLYSPPTLQPNGELGSNKQLVAVGSKGASNLQGQGWALTSEGPFNPPEVKPPEEKPPEVKPPEEKPPEVKPPEEKPPEVKPGFYKGKGGQVGELPKNDGKGHYSWILADGTVYSQPGFSLEAGKTGWEYLGEHLGGEWTSAETLYGVKPPPKPFELMNDLEKKEYLDQAHMEIDQQFMIATAQGQTGLMADLSRTLENYKITMKSEDLQMNNDIKNTIDAIEAAGMTFTGKARYELGDFYSAVGKLSSDDLNTILANMGVVDKIRKGALGTGATMAVQQMPKPTGIDDVNNPATGNPWTDAEKVAAWKTVYATPAWTDWTTTIAGLAGKPTDVGVAGTGTYGLGEQLNRFAGTRALEGNVMATNRGIQESSRNAFNQNIYGYGTAAEKMLGTGGLTGFGAPTIGGQSIFNPAQNVFGSNQGTFGTNIGTRANQLGGAAAEQFSYTFPL